MASIRSTIRIARASVRLRRIPSCRADDGVGARVAGLYSKKKQPDDGNSSSADRTDLCEGSSLDRHCHQECGEADQGGADQAHEDAARHHELPRAHGQGITDPGDRLRWSAHSAGIEAVRRGPRGK